MGGCTAASILPTSLSQMRKFVRAEAVPDEDTFNIDVMLKKEDYDEPGSLDYRKNMAMATAGLAAKFGVAHHKIVAGSEEGDQAMSLHVQQVI